MRPVPIFILALLTPLILLTGLAVGPADAGEVGSAGMLFLRTGIDARSAGMGETGVAGATDASAVYWNPALLALAPGTQVGLQHMEMYDLFRMESVFASHATPYGNFGLLLTGFYSDEVERTELDRVGEVLGTFQPYDLVGGLSWGKAFGTVMVGATAKVLYERIDAYSGTAFAMDLGIAHDSAIEGLRLGAAVQHLGSELTLNEEATKLPTALRAGVLWNPQLDSAAWARRIDFSGEFLAPNDGSPHIHGGVEFELERRFVIRGGYRGNYDTWGETFGAGFRNEHLAVDYAWQGNQNDFDPTHRISIRFDFEHLAP
ncbi:hypothetical protein DRQ53_02700 [bacterium]|nr:MAG: hypothetical protein DRQ32_09110 [bacterium]RKZ17717.1 MAG: hypothetical protein DRQ53_02700 [bacterium]